MLTACPKGDDKSKLPFVSLISILTGLCLDLFFIKKTKITSKKYFFLDIPFSYAKILGETNFQLWEFPRSW